MSIAEVLRFLGIARCRQSGIDRKRFICAISMLEDPYKSMETDSEMGQSNRFDDRQDDGTLNQVSGRILPMRFQQAYMEIRQISRGTRFQRQSESRQQRTTGRGKGRRRWSNHASLNAKSRVGTRGRQVYSTPTPTVMFYWQRERDKTVGGRPRLLRTRRRGEHGAQHFLIKYTVMGHASHRGVNLVHASAVAERLGVGQRGGAPAGLVLKLCTFVNLPLREVIHLKRAVYSDHRAHTCLPFLHVRCALDTLGNAVGLAGGADRAPTPTYTTKPRKPLSDEIEKD
jgi:hypothetical protein